MSSANFISGEEELTKNGIKPDPSKTEKRKNYPIPKEYVSQVRQFQGLAFYYQHFVPGFARIASPLHALLEKDAVVQLNCGVSGCICSVENPTGECPSPILSSVSLQTSIHF